MRIGTGNSTLPRRAPRVVRTQLNSKMEIGLRQQLEQYASDMGATMQDVIETAVREYMDRHPVDGDAAAAVHGDAHPVGGHEHGVCGACGAPR